MTNIKQHSQNLKNIQKQQTQQNSPNIQNPNTFDVINFIIAHLIIFGPPILALKGWYADDLELRPVYRAIITTIFIIFGPFIYYFYRKIFFGK